MFTRVSSDVLFRSQFLAPFVNGLIRRKKALNKKKPYQFIQKIDK